MEPIGEKPVRRMDLWDHGPGTRTTDHGPGTRDQGPGPGPGTRDQGQGTMGPGPGMAFCHMQDD